MPRIRGAALPHVAVPFGPDGAAAHRNCPAQVVGSLPVRAAARGCSGWNFDQPLTLNYVNVAPGDVVTLDVRTLSFRYVAVRMLN
jgi:hypothetical protein